MARKQNQTVLVIVVAIALLGIVMLSNPSQTETLSLEGESSSVTVIHRFNQGFLAFLAQGTTATYEATQALCEEDRQDEVDAGRFVSACLELTEAGMRCDDSVNNNIGVLGWARDSNLVGSFVYWHNQYEPPWGGTRMTNSYECHRDNQPSSGNGGTPPGNGTSPGTGGSNQTCAQVCLPMYEATSTGCAFVACGSGCGPDNTNTFATAAECMDAVTGDVQGGTPTVTVPQRSIVTGILYVLIAVVLIAVLAVGIQIIRKK